MSSDTKHIELVTLKIGLAETDDELESILLKFMAPILQILQTTDGGVRTKVLSLLTHINKRLKARESIQLPVEALLHQFNDESMNSFVTNFSVIYMKTGFKRLDADKKLQLLPLLFISLKGKIKNQQNHLLRLIAENLTLVSFDNATTRPFFEEFNFQENEEQLTVLLDYFLEVVIMPYSTSLKDAIGSASTSADILIPGLSKNSIRRLLGDQELDHWSFDKIEQIKMAILKFIKLDFVDASKTVAHLVVASSDTRFSVATNADQQLRNSLTVIKWSDDKMTMALYRIYLGHAANLTHKPGPEDKVQPANIRIKLKLMQYLLRCPAATEMFPHNIQVVYDGLFAGSNVKLKILALQFMHYIFDNAAIDKLKKQAPMLLNAAIKVVRERAEDSNRIQGLAYTSITKLAARLPQLFAEKFDLLQQFIDSLGNEESVEVKQSIVEATTSMIPAFSDLSEEKIASFRPLVDKSMSNKDHCIRMVGVRYAANIFGETDVNSRYMLLLSTADPKEDVAAEASNFIRMGLKSGKMPSFELMLNHVSLKAEERIHSRFAYSIGVQSLAFHPVAFKAIIKFVFVCFLKKCNAVLRNEEDEDFSTNHQQQLEFDLSAVVNFVKNMLASDREKACMLMNKLMRLMVDYSALVQDPFVLNLMLKTTGATCHLISIEQLFENRNPRSKSMSKDKCMEWAESLAYHNKDETSYVGAEFFALIFSHDQPSADKYVSLLRKLEGNLSSKTHEEQHGGILLLAYLLGDYLSWSHHSSATENAELKTFTSGLLIQLGEIANTSSDQNLVAASCFAIGEIARKSPLPLPDGQITKQDAEGEEVKFTRPATKLDFILLLRNRQRGKFTHRVRQRAAIALGKMPVGESPFTHTALIRQALFDTSKSKDTDSKHFVIGEALINCALGPQSIESLNKWTGKPIHMVALLENGKPQDEDAGMDVDLEDPKGMEELLDKILDDYVEHRLPSARQASCIWLTKILTSVECTRLPTISQHLIRIQNAFTALILESDELTQDLASKGLCLVYELGDQSQKEALVSDLVDSLMGNTPGTSQTVRILGDESQKFFRDVKARKSKEKKIEGPSLLLYKEMCSLASDLNRPELVYKFLYLQNHRAVGNGSKSDDPTNAKVYSSNQKKSEVDYKSVVESTRAQLEPMHQQIIPRLYRNTFDPQPNVRTAMTSIWNVICPEPNKAISAYLPDIVRELLTGLTHMLWRNRQASCLALIDLLRLGVTIQMHSDESGKTVAVKGNPIVDNLAEIWSTALRVQDDMKESVREAATKLCRSLQKVTLKLIDPQQSSQMKENVLTDVINVLLKEGMLSRVKESRAVSLNTLVEVSKLSGELIKPCISVLVVSLLEALSEVEPPQINYLRNRSEQVTQDKLDWIRAEFIKSTPMMETAVRCMKHYDSTVLDDLVPALAELTKRGVGVPTKAGCAHFACQLVSICGHNLTPYAGKLLKVFVSGIRDPSLAIRKVNASAVGNLSRVAKDASVSRSIEKFKEWYLKEDDETSRHASASAIYAIARHSPDTMQRHLAEVMPLAFYAMHGKVVTAENKSTNKDSNKVTKNDDQSFDMSPKEMFEAVWNEFTPGSETAVRIYLDEIVTLASGALTSQNWESKAQAAKTMSSVARYQTSHAIQPAHLNRLLEALVGGLRGRQWVGKNYLLSALKDLLKHHGGDFDQETVEKVLDSLLDESGRSKNNSYRCEALVCYGTAAAALKLDKLQPLWEATLKLINPDKRDSDGEDDLEDASARKIAREEICRSIFPVADNMWSATEARVREEYGDEFLTLVVDAYVNGIYQTRVICLSSVLRFLESILDGESGNSETAVAASKLSQFSYVHSKLFQVLLQALGDMKYSQLRQKGAAVVTLLCRLSKAGVPFTESSELKQLCDVLKQQITACSDLTSTADNIDALEYMRNALGNIEDVLTN